MAAYKTPNKPASKRGNISGFYQGIVVEVVATEVDPYQIKVDVPRLGHQSAGPYPYVGPPPAVGDAVWVSFVEGRENDLVIFNAGHQNNDDISEGVYRFGGATEEFGVTIHVEPTGYATSNRASMRLDKTQITGGGSMTGLQGATAGDFGLYDYQTGGWTMFHSGAWGGYSTSTWNDIARGSLANYNNTWFGIYAGNKHGTPSGDFYRGIVFYPSYDSDGTGYELCYINWIDNSSPSQTNPSDNGNSYYWIKLGRYGYWGGSFYPTEDNIFDLGRASYRWDDIYATNSSIQTSDMSLKKDIEDTDLGLDFIKSLRPVSYKWRETKGESGTRKHYGFIGQEVETALGDKASETAIWTKTVSPAEEELKQTEQVGPDGTTYMDGPVRPARDEETRQGLRYGELISPTVKAVQELDFKVQEAISLSNSANDYVQDFDAKMLAKQPASEAESAKIVELEERIAALEAG